jgi:hypothetical protein
MEEARDRNASLGPRSNEDEQLQRLLQQMVTQSGLSLEQI